MGRFGTAKLTVYEYKKGEWCKERNTCGKTTDSNAECIGKILLKMQKMEKR
jgi:hypothetical protein